MTRALAEPANFSEGGFVYRIRGSSSQPSSASASCTQTPQEASHEAVDPNHRDSRPLSPLATTALPPLLVVSPPVSPRTAPLSPSLRDDVDVALASLMRQDGVHHSTCMQMMDSDVIGFESAPDDEQGSHAAIVLDTEEKGSFPPNCLFRLREVVPAGQWEAPGGTWPMQRLLVVSATYHPHQMGAPAADPSSVAGGSKMCGRATTLSYGSRQSFVAGLDACIDKPVLTMEAECTRVTQWTDHKGVAYTLCAEWAYVNGRARRTEGMTAGVRDDGWNAGKSVDDFLHRVNEFIRGRRVAGHGQRLPDAHAMLTRDEVLAVRLFSGPAFALINAFLRQLAALDGDFRMQVARHPRLTFAATVGHLCHAIRKLAAVATPDEATETLYRGVRGELPLGFWNADEQGMVVAVDMGFMSTSRQLETPLSYLAGGPGAHAHTHTHTWT